MLGDDLADALDDLRAQALSRMESRVTIAAPTGRRVDAPHGGRVAEHTVVARGVPARLAATRGATGTRRVPVGDVEVQLATRTLHLPHDVAEIPDGSVAHVDSGERAGTWWLVAEGDRADQQTATRLPVVATTKPEGWPT